MPSEALAGSAADRSSRARFGLRADVQWILSEWHVVDIDEWGREGGRNLRRPVLRAGAAVTRSGATERGTSGVEHPRLRGLTADPGSGNPG